MKRIAFLKKTVTITFIVILILSSIACAPKEYRKGVDFDRDFPDDIIPIYDDAIVFEFDEKDDEEFTLNAGTKDDLDDVTDFYIDYFDDNGIVPDKVKEKKTKYKAEGKFQGYTYEVTVKKPSAKWEKKLYETVIEIEIEGKKSAKGNGQSFADISFSPVDIIDNQSAKDILKSIQQDLILINELTYDSVSDEEMTAEQSMAQIDVYQERIDAKTNEILSRSPNETELVHLQNSEITLFEISKDMLGEFEQIFYYASDVTAIFDIFNDTIVNAQGKGYGDMQSEMVVGFNTCNNALMSITVPSFMAHRHNRLIEKLGQLSLVSHNMLFAIDNNDYLRMSSYTYFLDYYLRYIEAFAVSLEADFNNRIVKFESDIAYIETWSKDLEYFIDNTLNTNTLDLALYNKDYIIQTQEVVVSCIVASPDEIVPANYRSMEYLAFLELSTNKDSANLMVTVEIPEYTQKYQEKITVARAETELAIKPPLLNDMSEKLSTSKEAQIVISVLNLDTDEIIIQETRAVKLYSMFDMRWGSNEGVPYYENVLAWVTPENDSVLTLLRNAADSIETITNGAYTSIVGYQGQSEEVSGAEITYWQTAAIMNAMADTMQVKYINAAFSSTDTGLQRIATPERVLDNASGLCIETAVTLASALQAAGMKPMILLLPGHAQVAVETWEDSTEYLLVETTALDSFKNQNFDDAIFYLSKDEWRNYIETDQVTAITCYASKILDIHPID